MLSSQNARAASSNPSALHRSAAPTSDAAAPAAPPPSPPAAAAARRRAPPRGRGRGRARARAARPRRRPAARGRRARTSRARRRGALASPGCRPSSSSVGGGARVRGARPSRSGSMSRCSLDELLHPLVTDVVVAPVGARRVGPPARISSCNELRIQQLLRVCHHGRHFLLQKRGSPAAVAKGGTSEVAARRHVLDRAVKWAASSPGCFSSKASRPPPTRPPPAASSRQPRARARRGRAPPGWDRQRLQLHAQQQREGGATMRAVQLPPSRAALRVGRDPRRRLLQRGRAAVHRSAAPACTRASHARA